MKLQNGGSAGRHASGSNLIESGVHFLTHTPLHRERDVGGAVLEHRHHPVVIDDIDDPAGFVLDDFLRCRRCDRACDCQESSKETNG